MNHNRVAHWVIPPPYLSQCEQDIQRHGEEKEDCAEEKN